MINCFHSLKYRLKYRLNRITLEKLYKSYILPLFDYCDRIWSNCTEGQERRLEQFQLDAWNSFSWMLGTVSFGCLEQFQLDALRAMCGAVRGIITIKSITKPGLFL